MAEAEFEARVLELNGHSPDLAGNPELLSLILPVVRADLQVIESFQMPSKPFLTCPVSAFGGDNDPRSPPVSLMGWAAVTTGSFEVHTVSGDHFFVHNNGAHVARKISQILTQD